VGTWLSGMALDLGPTTCFWVAYIGNARVSCSGWHLLNSKTVSGHIPRKVDFLMPGCLIWSGGTD
jgi:hypothetical protein